MKTLYLIRHAKSSWDNTELSDFERPLNKRGNRDAPFMANLLKSKNIQPDLLVSSSSLRAYSTAEYFAKEFNYPIEKIKTDERIYEATSKIIVEVIKEIEDSFSTVFLFGHNPGLSNIANIISDKLIEPMPTCCVAGFELKVNSWKELERHCGKHVLYEYPKKHP